MPELTPVKLTLRQLFLSENQLVRFPKDYFEGFMQLERLEVAHNHLVALPSLGWLTSTLRILSMDNNYITSLDGINTRKPFKELTSLDLSHNQIHEIDVQILSKLPNVKYIFLQKNHIRHLDDYRPFFPQTHIQLHENPFHCDTKMAWISTILYIFTNGPTCETPWCLKGRMMLKMSKYFNWTCMVTITKPCYE